MNRPARASSLAEVDHRGQSVPVQADPAVALYSDWQEYLRQDAAAVASDDDDFDPGGFEATAIDERFETTQPSSVKGILYFCDYLASQVDEPDHAEVVRRIADGVAQVFGHPNA